MDGNVLVAVIASSGTSLVGATALMSYRGLSRMWRRLEIIESDLRQFKWSLRELDCGMAMVKEKLSR